MTLNEPSNESIRNDRTYAFEYNGYFYEAIGYISGRTHQSRIDGDYDSSRMWETASKWCEFYACYRIRSEIHKHNPVPIADCYMAFLAIELPTQQNMAATTMCEVDNG